MGLGIDCQFFFGIGDCPHLWWGSLSPCPSEACHLKGPWLFPLGESVPALSDVRVLVPRWFPLAPWSLTRWLLTHFGFACSCPLGSEPSLHLKLLYYSALSCLQPSASTCFLLGVCTSCSLFLAHTSFLSSSGWPYFSVHTTSFWEPPWSSQTALGASPVWSQSSFTSCSSASCRWSCRCPISCLHCLLWALWGEGLGFALRCVPSTFHIAGDVVGREAHKEQMVEGPPNKPSSPTICFGLAVALAAAGLPVLHGRQKPL